MLVNAGLVIPSNFFVGNGKLEVRGITSVNGIFPKAGAAGNMTGNGSGFLYFERYQDFYKSVVIGRGLYSKTSASIKEALSEPSAGSIVERLHTKIKSVLAFE